MATAAKLASEILSVCQILDFRSFGVRDSLGGQFLARVCVKVICLPETLVIHACTVQNIHKYVSRGRAVRQSNVFSFLMTK